MDPVLSRKLFREKYIEEIKPQKFNQGGIAVLKFNQGGEVFSEGEKLGYMLAQLQLNYYKQNKDLVNQHYLLYLVLLEKVYHKYQQLD
jgi:hypothetical protein